MSKDLEQLRLNMITSMMDLDHKSLMKIKHFMEGQEKIGWEDYFSDENVDFVDYSKLSKISNKNKKRTSKPSIVFL